MKLLGLAYLCIQLDRLLLIANLMLILLLYQTLNLLLGRARL